MPEDAAGSPSTGPRSTEPRVVFIHVPKTAGTSLRAIMRANASHSARLGNVFKGGGGRALEPDYERMVAKMRDVNVDARFFWGHTPFALASYMPAEWETHFVTFLRDPVERAISQYYGMVARLERRDPDGNGNSGVSDEDDAGGSLRKPWLIRGEFGLDVPYEVALADRAYVSDNLTTRMLSGLPRPFGEVTDDMLARAIENLGRFRCVGITERFDESLVLLQRRLGYERLLSRPQRVNHSRPRGHSVPDALRRAAQEANTFDRELYRHAVALFDSASELGDPDFAIDVAALRSAQAGSETRKPGRARRGQGQSKSVVVPEAQPHGSELEAERRQKKRQRRQAALQQSPELNQKARKRERKSQRRGAVQQQQEHEPLIAFVHIPKTAGGTLKSVFSNAFGRAAVHDSGNYPRNPERTAAQSFQLKPGTRITIGHVPYGLYRPRLPLDTRYITFLREPVERVISHYYRHFDGHVNSLPLPEALECGIPDVTNLMTRFLCGYGHPEALGALADTAVEDAKLALESFLFVGFQDRFDESLVLLEERLGMPMTAYGASRHVNAERPSFEQVGGETIALIEKYNQLDVELYAWARDRFGAIFDARGDDLGGAVETLRGAVAEKAAEQIEGTERALRWLTEQLPPGTGKSFKALRVEAEKIGITTPDLQRARRRMNPPSRKIRTDRGVMLVVAPVGVAVRDWVPDDEDRVM